MTKRHYFTSVVIFIATTYFLKTVLEILWPEAIMLVLLAIVCVIHTDDVLEDLRRKRIEKKLRENGNGNGGNGGKT